MPSRSKLVGAGLMAFVAFVVVAGMGSRPDDPGARLPQSYRLADLIAREQANSAQLRRQADQLRRSVADQAAGTAGAAAIDGQLAAAATQAGLAEVRGPGLRVILDDSNLVKPPTGNINDLVIHSQDVQAVVNALWHAGAEAMAINGQRLVATSAVLCVGNTLLLDGTVHSPPYAVAAIGAGRPAFDADPLVRRLRHDADQVHLGFSVERVNALDVPRFPGPLTLKFATPVPR